MPRGKGRRKRLRNGLTPKQNAFTKEIIKQIATTGEANATEAAMKVYDVGNNRQLAGSVGYENMKNPQVKQTIEEALNAKGGNFSQIAENLQHLASARPLQVPASTVLKANVEILKLLGAYPDKKQPQNKGNLTIKLTNITFNEAKEELNKRTSEAKDFVQEADLL